MTEETLLIETINKELALGLPAKLSYAQLKEQLAAYINQLITDDFEKLVFYLYRIDVNEQKMKALLQKPHPSSGELIAQLIIERQMEKLKTKAENRSSANKIDEDEKW
ncbi:MAG: hypothetical protein K2X48_08345 [Chitinophagaceae bacterium]|nr:hypothetical protein [Chitinophagaceae bacterium]